MTKKTKGVTEQQAWDTQELLEGKSQSAADAVKLIESIALELLGKYESNDSEQISQWSEGLAAEKAFAIQEAEIKNYKKQIDDAIGILVRCLVNEQKISELRAATGEINKALRENENTSLDKVFDTLKKHLSLEEPNG